MTKIAVLVLDTPNQLAQRWGDFGDLGIEMMKQSPLASGCEFVKFNTINKFEHPSLEALKNNEYSAMYLSGSRCDSFDDKTIWIQQLVKYISEIIKLQREDKTFNLKLVGICFGHQIIARAAGLNVNRNVKGWEMGLTTVNTSKPFKDQFGYQKFNVIEMHHDVVTNPLTDLPQGWEPVGSSPKTVHQGFYWPEHIITFQGHPEFTSSYSTEMLLKNEHFTEEECKEAIERNTKEVNDGYELADVILRVIKSTKN